MARDQIPQWFLDSDPARDVRRPASPNDPALQAILRTPSTPPAPTHTPSPVRTPRLAMRRGFWAVAGAAAAVAAVAVGTSVLTPAPAFADWTPEPAVPPAGFLDSAAAVCDLSVTEITEIDGQAQVVQHPAELVLADLRGAHAYVIGATEDGWSECFVSAAQNGQGLIVSTNGGHNPGGLDEPGADAITLLGNGTTSWTAQEGEPDGSFTSAYGRAGDDVTQVTLTTRAGEEVEATVDNGWWAAWIPSTEEFQDEVSVSLLDGSESAANISIAG